MKVAIIGTTSYLDRMMKHKATLEKAGDDVGLPAFDNDEMNLEDAELQICLYNRDLIKWADEVHLFWDQRSFGTMFDLGMCVALDKPVKAIYIEPKTFKNVILQWEKRCVVSGQ
jgi:nucleoside 2-deoxyribosyltransferase